jgi:predicted DNA-binding protein with PD1-like motif
MKSKLLRDQTHLLVFDRGDEVMETLTRFARENALAACSFQAIGALQSVTFAYWNPQTKQYENLQLAEQVEVVSLSGNIAAGEQGEPKVHAHIAVGRRSGELRGGHLVQGTVFPTLEVILVDYGGRLDRKKDADTALALLKLP